MKAEYGNVEPRGGSWFIYLLGEGKGLGRGVETFLDKEIEKR